MVSKPEAERIVTLEVQMSNLEKKVDAGFTDISKKIDKLSNDIVARNAVVDSRFVDRDDYEKRITNIERELNKRWVNNTLSAILGAVITGLIGAVFYFVTRGV